MVGGTPFIKKTGKTKEYGMTRVEAVKIMQAKIENTKNELYKPILSLYMETPPRQSMDYTKMLVNQLDDKKKQHSCFCT